MNASLPAIQARRLVKKFGDLRAVDGIDLDAAHGRFARLATIVRSSMGSTGFDKCI